MSRKVFEYFFDPDDLEPFYSALPKEPVRTDRARRVGSNAKRPAATPSAVASTRSPSSPDESTPADQDGNGPTNTADTQERVTVSESAAGPVLSVTDAPPPEQARAEPGRTRVRRLLSVHALGQRAFCLRSAILAAEKGDLRDVDEGLPSLTYLPNFDRERIEELLSAKITQLGFFGLYGVCLVVLMRIALAEQNRWVFYPSLIALLGLGFYALGVVVCIVDLVFRRRAALRAEAREPELHITRIEPVNWWSMLQAGFEPIRYERPFQHPELPLEGAPWRVLQRGSLRIPVIRSGGAKLGDKKGELYPKHQVRLAAYALLLEATGHLEAPYGLVFPVDTPHGLAFPLTDAFRNRVLQQLDEFEQEFAESQHAEVQPPLPENKNRCTHCVYGKPLPTTAREVEQLRKSGQQLVVLQHASGELYRCECGDRFGSAPPHGLTIKKGLTARVD